MPEKTLVMKFGGTSVGTPAAMGQAAQIVAQARSQWPRLVVITSALSGVTNLLLESATQATLGKREHFFQAAQQLRSSHSAIADALIGDPDHRARVMGEINLLVDDFNDLCQAIRVIGEASPRALDSVAAFGERMSVRLLSAALEVQGTPAQPVESTQLIVTDSRFQDAHPNLEATTQCTRQLLGPVFDAGKVVVTTGFIAANQDGVTTTLGRGGSDYSAALLGAALPADEVWIWTDVDGVMTADPRIVPSARTIAELSYREVAELAYFGAKVLHPKTIRPVIEAGIGLRVCNTFNPEHPGTRIVPDTHAGTNGKIKAVTAIPGQRLITLEGRGMLGVPGVAARTFGAVASTGTSVPLITQASSEQSICFAVPAQATPMVLASLEEVFSAELARRDIDRIWATGDVVIVTAVGAGMRHTPGIAGRVFSTLGDHAVNVIAIAQGSSEVSISLVVDEENGHAAVRALHELIVNV